MENVLKMKKTIKQKERSFEDKLLFILNNIGIELQDLNQNMVRINDTIETKDMSNTLENIE